MNWDSSSDPAILASSFDIVEEFNSTTSTETKQDSISEAETEITTISPIDGSSEAPGVGKSATGEDFTNSTLLLTCQNYKKNKINIICQFLIVT